MANNGDANSYGVIHNLGSEGVPVISFSSDPRNITFHSRYADAVLCTPFDEQESSFIDELVELGELLEQKPVLFANGDEISLTLLRHRERLQQFYHLPFASYEVARQLTEKMAFYRLLEQQGIPHARAWQPRTLADLEEVATRISYPCVVKPSQSQTFSPNFGNKCLRADSPEQLRELFKRVIELESDLIVQEMIEGDERYLVYNYYSQQGEHKAICSYRKERIYPIDFGNATACRTVLDQELEDLVTELMRVLDYRGLGEAEVQRDSRDGSMKVIEVNIRSTTQCRLPAACGVNTEHIAYRDMLGEQQSLIANRKAGVVWADLYRDALAIFTADGYRKTSGVRTSQWLKSLRGEKVLAICSLRDPLPSVVLLFRVFRMHLWNRTRLKRLFGGKR